MKIRLEDATATQLSRFAWDTYGLEVPHTKGRENIIAQLQRVGFDAEEIDIAGEAPPVAGQTGNTLPPDVERTDTKRRMVRITIAEQDIPGSSEGKEPVKVSVNGKLMYVTRGKPVDIPYEYYEVLEHAKFRQFDEAPDEFTALGEARHVPRFPITVHRIDEPVAA